MVTRQLTVIAYDVRLDRHRNRLRQYLLRYGIRSNYSVFECMLTDTQYQQIRQQIPQMIDLQTDRVLFYRICKSCYHRSEQIGRINDWPDESVLEV